jgi:NADH-quinone oxidoreductase subunit J
MIPFLFLGFGALLVASSLLVILHKSPVTSALYLVLAFCSLAGIYLVLQAEFIGMVQIIVYAGAIMVLFLFVIMYLNLQRDVESGPQTVVRRAIGLLVGALFVVQGVGLIRNHGSFGPQALVPPPPGVGNSQALGQILYSRYLFPFEITSILLLVAMVGAVVIAKGRAQRPLADLAGTANGVPSAMESATPSPGPEPSPAPEALEPAGSLYGPGGES